MTQELSTMSCLHAEFNFLDLNGATQEELFQIKGILNSRAGESLELPWNIEGEEAHENDSGVEPEATGSEYVYSMENMYMDHSVVAGHHEVAAMEQQQQHHVLEYPATHQHQAVVTTSSYAGFYVISNPKFVMTSEGGSNAMPVPMSVPVVDGSDVHGMDKIMYATNAQYDVHGMVQSGKGGRKKVRQHGPPPISTVGNTIESYGGQAPPPPQAVGMMLPTHAHHHPGHILPFVPAAYCAPHSVYMFSSLVPAPRNPGTAYTTGPQHYAAPPAAAFAPPMPHATFTFLPPQQHEQVTVLSPEEAGQMVHNHGDVVVLGAEEGLLEEEIHDIEYEYVETENFEMPDTYQPPEPDVTEQAPRQSTQWSEEVEQEEDVDEEEEDADAVYEPEDVPEVEPSYPEVVQQVAEPEKDSTFLDDQFACPPKPADVVEAPKTRSWSSLFVNNTSSTMPVSPADFSQRNQIPVSVYSPSQQNGESARNRAPSPVAEEAPKDNCRATTADQNPTETSHGQASNWHQNSKMKDALQNPNLDHRTVYLTPRGLVNKGNWCYINAILQALLVCPPFYNLIKKLSRLPDMKRDSDAFPILRSMVKFVMEFPPMPSSSMRYNPRDSAKGEQPKKGEIQQGQAFEPSYVYDVIGSVKTDFFKGRQEDAEEFLGWLLNGLHEEMLKAIGPGVDENGTMNNGAGPAISNGDVNGGSQEEEWMEMGRRNKSVITRSAKSADSPISTIFGGVMVSSFSEPGMTKCANKEPFFTLPLDIQSNQVTSLKEAIEGLFSKETVHGYTSSKTKKEVEASRKISLEALPPVLILHLKRFVYEKDGGCQKLTKRIEFPVDLEIGREFFAGRVRPMANERKFKLFAVVYHSGKETAKGHYVTDVYHSGTSGWLRTDDSCVTPVTVEQVLRHCPPRVPYLLFYRRFDTIFPMTTSYGK